MEFNFLRNFNVLDCSLSTVRSKASGINFEFKTKSIDNLNLCWREAVEFSHAFYFLELDVVSILELVSLVFVDSDDGRVSLSDVNNNKSFSFFSINIVDDKFFSII